MAEVTFESNNRGESSNKGYFTELRTIKNVTDISDQMHPNIMKQFDLMLKVEFEKGDKAQFEPYPLLVFGNFERDNSGNVIGKGSAFKVGVLLESAGLKFTIDSDKGNRVVPSLVAGLVGKQVAILSYIYGAKKSDDGKWRAKWATWDIVGKTTKEIAENFEYQVKNNKIRNFEPDAVKKADDSDVPSFEEQVAQGI